MFQILAWLAIFALPIVGVAGIFPPFRRWLMSLLQILLASYFARFAFGVALTMTELAYGIVFSSPFPFGVQILILLVIVVAAMHLIRAVREAGLTSSWSRAVHGSAAGMAGTAGRQAGRMGRTVLAGAAGGAAAVVLEERRERRTRRNTVDRPVTREETVATAPQTTPSERPEGPQVSPRRRRAGVVISADGTTTESDGALTGGRRVPRAAADQDDTPQDGPAASRNGAGSRDDALPANGPARTSGADDGGRPAEGPQVARRLRRDDVPQPSAEAAQPQPAVVAPSRQVATSAPIEPRRRQSTAQAPDSTPPPPPSRAPEPDPVQRRQGDRARFVDPEP
ncbi:MAG TPA: hypothetical protein VHX59_26205 [Mycobacteriales bacterium]|nr:hypothetical protein [Mycobacteriales bacterium]